MHWALHKLDCWFTAKENDVPNSLIQDILNIQEMLCSRMDYGEHPAMYLAAMLDPR
jgi:hypothetical protein